MLFSNMITPVDLLSCTAKELQARLGRGELTSVGLVQACLAQIARFNGPVIGRSDSAASDKFALRAVISLAPEKQIVDEAKRLDAERAANSLRGPLHGIPILLKVSLCSHFLRFVCSYYCASISHDQSFFSSLVSVAITKYRMLSTQDLKEGFRPPSARLRCSMQRHTTMRRLLRGYGTNSECLVVLIACSWSNKA